MSDWFKDTRTLSFEEILVDFVERLDRHRAGWIGAELHLSLLRPYHRQAHHARVVKQTLETLVRRHNASIYELHNGNIMILVKGAAIADVDAVVLQIRYLFSEDPLFKGGSDGWSEEAFCTWYVMDTDFAAFRRRVRQLNEARLESHLVGEGGAEPAQNEPPGQIMTPKQLEQIERAIEQADLANLLRRQDVCAVMVGVKPEKIYHELYFSMHYLASTILPGFDLTSNAWLFRHLTVVLDRRMLALMTRRESFSLLRAAALNLNVATVLSSDFLDFDKETNRPDRGPLVVELPGIDVLNEPADYLFARDFLRERGYKIAIDGLSHLLLPALDREWLGFDFIKVHWAASLFDDARGDRKAALASAVQRIGRDRVILCRVDSKTAIKAGGELGVSLFQGRTIDAMAGAAQSDTLPVRKA
jgi:hypothetical protein